MNDLYKYYLPNEEYIEQYADKAVDMSDQELFDGIDDDSYDEARDQWNQDYPMFKHLSHRQFLGHMWVWCEIERTSL